MIPALHRARYVQLFQNSPQIPPSQVLRDGVTLSSCADEHAVAAELGVSSHDDQGECQSGTARAVMLLLLGPSTLCVAARANVGV